MITKYLKTIFGILLVGAGAVALSLAYRDSRIDLYELIIILVFIGLGMNFISQTLLMQFIAEIKSILSFAGKKDDTQPPTS